MDFIQYVRNVRRIGKTVVLGVLLSVVSLNAHSACGVNACDGVGSQVVVLAMPISNGDIYLQAPADASNLNCTLHGGNKMTIRADSPNKNQIYATVLTAIALGSNFRVRINEGTSDCEVAYVWINS